MCKFLHTNLFAKFKFSLLFNLPHCCSIYKNSPAEISTGLKFSCNIQLKFDFLVDVSNQIFDFYSFLLHCVTVTNCYTAVFFGFEVVCDAQRCADFVLTTVAFADRACFVVVNHKVFLQ